jgi:hypothetical protein
MKTRVGAIVVLAGAVLLLATGVAAAEQLYASPSGSASSNCAEGSPCSAQRAFALAQAGAEIIIGPGTYQLHDEEALVSEMPGLNVHGAAGSAPPLIQAFQAESGLAMALAGPGSRASNLELTVNATESANGFVCGEGVQAERLRVVVAAAAARAIVLRNGCQLRSSVAVAHSLGEAAAGVSATDFSSSGTVEAQLRNVTAIATGPGGIGLAASAPGDPFEEEGGTYVVDTLNTIAIGAPVDVLSAGGLGTSLVKIANSDYDLAEGRPETRGSIIPGAGNQTAPPLFVGAAGEDYREATGSPTIDAGVVDPLIGSVALGGEARVIGPAPDIGAFETTVVVPPAIGKLTALSISPRSFVGANVGGAVISKKKKGAVGAKVSYTLSAPASVEFSVEQKKIKRVGKKHKRKVVFKPVKGAFSVSGASGGGSFRFAGRLGKKTLKPGSYRLVGEAGGAVKRASFSIVK